MNGQNNLLSIWYGPAYGFLYIQYHQHLCISPRSDVPQRRIFYRLFYSFRTTVLSALVRLSLYDSYSIVSRIFVFFLWIVFHHYWELVFMTLLHVFPFLHFSPFNVIYGRPVCDTWTPFLATLFFWFAQLILFYF